MSLKHGEPVSFTIIEKIDNVYRVCISDHPEINAFVPMDHPYYSCGVGLVHLLECGKVILSCDPAIICTVMNWVFVVGNYIKTKDDSHLRYCINLDISTYPLQYDGDDEEMKNKYQQYNELRKKEELMNIIGTEYLQNVLDTAHFYW